MLVRPEWRNLDPFFASLVLLLSGLGIFFVTSTSSFFLADRSILSSLALKQCLFLAVSILAFLVVVHVDYQWLARHAFGLFLLGVTALVVVKAIGTEEGGGRRWLPMGPFRLQPSEFMKVALILALARLLQFHDRLHAFRGLVRPFLLTLLPMALIVVQPDLGTALVFLPVLIVMLVAAGVRWRHLMIVFLIGVLAAPIVFSVGLKEYQKHRIMAFLNPGDPANQREALYQLAQSKLAIGSGGWFGKGYRQGTVPVPVQSTDFIYTVAGEEGGLVGGLAVIGLYLLLALYLLGIAAKTKERFGFLVVVGACALISFQSLVNLAMTMGFAPITGLTLPLMSYGGSSLLSTYVLLGLVANVQMRRLRPFGASRPCRPRSPAPNARAATVATMVTRG